MSHDPPPRPSGRNWAVTLSKVTFIVTSILIFLPLAVLFIDNALAVDTEILGRRDREFCAMIFQTLPMICAGSLIALALTERK